MPPISNRRSGIRQRPSWVVCSAALLALATLTQAHGQSLDQSGEGVALFRSRVAPVFESRCQGCHNNLLKFSGLSLENRDGFRRGGLHGPVVTPGDPLGSRLYRKVARLEKPSMPMQGDPLTDEEVSSIKKWIELGSPWPEDPADESEERRKASRLAMMKRLEDRRVITDEDRRWWSFRPPTRPPVPRVQNSRLVYTPIDAFLLAKLEQKGLKPAPVATKETLIRRLSFDLTGLPPRPEDVERFLQDDSPDAYHKLVERLLDSDRYGERWGRHWLDVVRYADSDGYEYDAIRKNSWRYRDYVIRAFNQDKPYDRFIREQIAGDELPDFDHDSLTALGFLRSGPFIGDMVLMQNEMTRADELDDIVSTTGLAFLGLTIGCARCHDHKYDPIPQKDYYRLVAVFAPAQRKELPLAPPDLVRDYEAAVAKIDQRIEDLKARVKAIQKPTRELLLQEKYKKLPEDVQIALKTPKEQRSEAQKLQADQVAYSIGVADSEIEKALPEEDRKKIELLGREIDELEKSKPPALPAAHGVKEAGGAPPPTYFLHQGSTQSKGSEIGPGALSVLVPPGEDLAFPEPEPGKSSGRRLAFANWLARPDNPLTARVMVNRIWQHYFGRGIVGTPSDYGRMGEPPTHPELLDWLAVEFVERGWSIKAMHRMIVTSRFYMQDSKFSSASNHKIDPENTLLWKMPLRRLEGEAIRDSILSVSGALNLKMGGPPIFPEVDPEVLKGAAYQVWPKTTDGPEMWRRSVYVAQMRSIIAPIMDLFDPPDNVASCARRSVTTVAPQALQLLNNKFVAGQAEIFADRLRNEAGRDVESQVGLAFRLALGRSPRPPEVQAAMQFLERQREFHELRQTELRNQGIDPAEILTPAKAALVDFCHSLFNLNEFVYVN